MATGNLPRVQRVNFTPLPLTSMRSPSPISPAPRSPVTPPPPAPLNRGRPQARIKRPPLVDYDEVISGDEVSSRGTESRSPDLEATPRGRGTTSTQESHLRGSQSGSDVGSKRGTVDDPEGEGPSSKRPRRSSRGKGKAKQVADSGLDLGEVDVAEDTPLDVNLVPRAANTVRRPFLLRWIS